jgi:phytoene synthase
LRDRDLVRLYWPVELRPAFDALFDIDEAMGDVVAKATEPALAAIKLAGWRERLEELDEGKSPAEPRLRAAAEQLLARGMPGKALAEIEDGWAALLEAEPDVHRVESRGARLFALGSRLLGAADPHLEAAGRLYGRESARRRGLITSVQQHVQHRFPRALRPLTALAALAARDAWRRGCEPEATPGRAWTLVRHRLTGRVG